MYAADSEHLLGVTDDDALTYLLLSARVSMHSIALQTMRSAEHHAPCLNADLLVVHQSLHSADGAHTANEE